MLPIVVAIICLNVIKQRQRSTTSIINPTTTKPLMTVSSAANRVVSGPKSNNNNLRNRPESPTPMYRPEIIVAKRFLDHYLKLPHIVHVNDINLLTKVGHVQAYSKRYNTRQGNCLWQVCAIMTKYGYIYLSLMIELDGNVSPNAAGVLLTYDDVGISHLIYNTIQKQIERFGRVVFNYDECIQDEDLLKLILGDYEHLFSVNTYFR